MKVKTSELSGIALDWVVTMIEKPEDCEHGVEYWQGQRRQTVKNSEYVYRWHQSWAQGGPIIEHEEISVGHQPSAPNGSQWYATNRQGAFGISNAPLIAAMRCYVASKLGDTVDVPEELL